MSKERAAWNYTYEKGLVNTMRDHVNIPMFRGQNGWTIEGWRNIGDKFNKLFPLARFTKAQLQEKEKELKGSWKAIRDARKESGVGWNDSMNMIIAEPEKWKELISKNGKIAKFQKKPFPLYEHYGPDITSALNKAQSAHSNQDFLQGPSGGRKRKQSHIGSAIEDFVQFKKMQTSKTMDALNEKKKKQDEEFSIDNCLDEVVAMDGLTNVDKAYAMTIFKSVINREVFMKMKDKSVPLIWLKQQISALGGGNLGGL